jgi:hypothetical protein
MNGRDHDEDDIPSGATLLAAVTHRKKHEAGLVRVDIPGSPNRGRDARATILGSLIVLQASRLQAVGGRALRLCALSLLA